MAPGAMRNSVTTPPMFFSWLQTKIPKWAGIGTEAPVRSSSMATIIGQVVANHSTARTAKPLSIDCTTQKNLGPARGDC